MQNLCLKQFDFTFGVFFASSVFYIRPCEVVVPSGHLLVGGGGSSGESWRIDPHGAWLTTHWHNTKPAIEARTSALAVCCLPAPTADVRYESLLCSPCRGADHLTAWRHVHADEDAKLSKSLFRDKPRAVVGIFFFQLGKTKFVQNTEANLHMSPYVTASLQFGLLQNLIWASTRPKNDWAKSENKFPDVIGGIILLQPQGLSVKIASKSNLFSWYLCCSRSHRLRLQQSSKPSALGICNLANPVEETGPYSVLLTQTPSPLVNAAGISRCAGQGVFFVLFCFFQNSIQERKLRKWHCTTLSRHVNNAFASQQIMITRTQEMPPCWRDRSG